jgi:hypothetical protein
MHLERRSSRETQLERLPTRKRTYAGTLEKHTDAQRGRDQAKGRTRGIGYSYAGTLCAHQVTFTERSGLE